MKAKKILFSPVVTVLAFILAVGLLLFSSVGGARAALTYFSETYATQIKMDDIGVSLLENGERVSWRDYNFEVADGSWDENTGELLKNMLDKEAGEKLQIGRTYTEELSVSNSGTINQYVRVTVLKYWLNEKGEKAQEYSPAMIDLHLTNLDSAWLLDASASTTERTVLYYNRLLESGHTTPLFADTLTIDEHILTQAYEVREGNTVRTVYTYDGVEFCIEAKVDAVQENNAEDAVLSAWGQNVVVDPVAGTLNLR